MRLNNDIFGSITKSKRIAIAGHVRPDGDCVGSCTALHLYLKKQYPDKIIDTYLELIPDSFQFLKDTDKIITNYDEDIIYDLFISLDSGDVDRLGPAEKYFDTAISTINIDHHISNTNFAVINYVMANASSTCETLFDLFDEDIIDQDIAEALYLGIVHDTGVFKHSNTTRNTMTIAGKLIEKGFSFSTIIDESFFQKTYVQNQILGRCLLESIFVLGKKCIVSTVSLKILDFYGAGPKDLDGVIDQLRVTKGVEVAILIQETASREYKVSLRSNNHVDVSRIAVYFGGGGHIKAAGCSMSGTIHDVINNLTKHIENQL